MLKSRGTVNESKLHVLVSYSSFTRIILELDLELIEPNSNLSSTNSLLSRV